MKPENVSKAAELMKDFEAVTGHIKRFNEHADYNEGIAVSVAGTKVLIFDGGYRKKPDSDWKRRMAENLTDAEAETLRKMCVGILEKHRAMIIKKLQKVGVQLDGEAAA